MENYYLDSDINTFFVRASSFPDGIKPAFQKLHSLIGSTQNRQFFGISYMEGAGKIIYKAAVEETHPNEGKKLGCETFVIRKGEYASIYIKDFMKDITSMGNAFNELLKHPNLDPQGYCLEIYEGMNNVRCMVPLKK